MNEKLADKLYFSKEAADYLNITTQRLNALVKDGKIKPLKKSTSGTIFHIDELNRRREEQMIFNGMEETNVTGKFCFDTDDKIEALNFSTLINVLGKTEQTLEPLFEEFSRKTDITVKLNESTVIKEYTDFFHVSKEKLLNEFINAEYAFSNLKVNDEVIKRGNQDYPPLLAKTDQAPRFLYIRGKKALLFEKRTVALVGARQASSKAKENTERLTDKLGENGITIVSGLAKGIDVTAHKQALKKGYNTIAVIGTNLNQYYPAENKEVQLMIEKKGLVVSQFSPAIRTQRWFFPMRNGVMSGLSLATIIMEAGETSGALKQADFALKQGREVLIPESALNIKSISWPAKYLEKGAKLVKTPKDVLVILADSNIFRVETRYIQESIENLRDFKEKSESFEGRFLDLVSDGE